MTETGRQPGEVAFGRRLQSWRHKNRLTQAQLADALGYDVTYIVKIEGGRRPPTRAFLARLSLLEEGLEKLVVQLSIGGVARPALPQPPDTLIGRDDEIRAVIELVGGPARCVTLVGPPGIGKTRLAMEVAARVDQVLADGAWWVPLLDVVDPEEVGPQLRRSLGVPAQGSIDPVDAVVDAMRGRDALIVLDNFEHVIAARGVVSRIVAGSTRLTVLVTSREALELVSEHVFTVSALHFPDPAANPPFETVRASSAVELFVARATMARPTFEMTAANCAAVLAICDRLEGVPLAIVLIAGGVKTLDAAGVAARLDGRVDLGVAGPFDMASHHQTLAAAIARSWALLGRDEQRFFATLAVFTGGFTAEAAAVVAGIGVDAATSLAGGLARKSLIEARPDAPGGPRFELLETIRVFVAEEAERSGRLHELRLAHLEYFVAFADRWGRRLVGAEQTRAARAFADDYENLQVAFDTALRVDPASAVALAAFSWRFFFMGDIPTGRRWLEAALAATTEVTAAWAVALAAAGALGWVTGHPDVAAGRLAEAATVAEQLDLVDVAALVSVNLGALAEQQDRLDDAEQHFAQALNVYRRIGDRRGQAVALNGLGVLRRRQGRVGQAWPLWVEAAALFRAVGDGTNEAIALGNQAWAAEIEGRLEEAEAISLECRRIQVALGDARGLAATTAALGRIAYLRQAFGEARALQLDALGVFQRLGDLPWVASTLLALAAVMERTGAAERAVALFGAAGKLWEQMGTRPRQEEQLLLDGLVRRCQAALDADSYLRAFIGGQALTANEAAVVATVDLAAGAARFPRPPNAR